MGLDPLTAGLLGGSAISGISSIIGGNKASDAIQQGAAGSVAEQRRQFDIATGLAQPSIDAGDSARQQLLRLLGLAPGGAPQTTTTSSPGGFQLPPELGGGSFPGFGGNTTTTVDRPVSADPLDVIRNTPGYEFQLEQGRRGLNTNRGAGGASGGELLRDFSRFNQGTASSFYQDYANRLANLAGTGQTAATQTGSFGIQTGANIGNSLQNAGNARASGILGASNTIADLIGGLAQGYGAGIFGGGGSNSASARAGRNFLTG